MRSIHNINMTVLCDRKEVLDILRKNREEHLYILRESKIGFIKSAKEKLLSELDKMNKLEEKYNENNDLQLSSLQVNKSAPSGHLEEYDTIIRMLEMSVENNIRLTADEVRQLIENKWDWMSGFIHSNREYSATAANLSL